MYLIQQITSDPIQRRTLVLPDGTSLTMTMTFIPMQYAWVITTLTYGSFTLNGINVTVNPNFLRQFKNQIPFGMACYTTQLQRDPSQQQDFSSNAFQLYLLDADEVQTYEEFLEGVPIG